MFPSSPIRRRKILRVSCVYFDSNAKHDLFLVGRPWIFHPNLLSILVWFHLYFMPMKQSESDLFIPVDNLQTYLIDVSHAIWAGHGLSQMWATCKSAMLRSNTQQVDYRIATKAWGWDDIILSDRSKSIVSLYKFGETQPKITSHKRL